MRYVYFGVLVKRRRVSEFYVGEHSNIQIPVIKKKCPPGRVSLLEWLNKKINKARVV